MAKKKKSPNIDSALYRRVDLASLLGVDLSTIDRWRKEGRLPEPIRLGYRVIAWRKEAIDQWLTSQSGNGVSSN